MRFKLLAGLVLVMVLPVAAVAVAIAMNRPMLFDPPGFMERLSIYLRYNVAETTADPLLPELRVRHYRLPEETVKAAVDRTIRSLPRWKMVRAEGDVGAYQAEVTSLIWRFRDDLSVLVTDSSSGEIEVYVHSASRIGRGDLGANRVHVLTFYEALERHLQENR
ncbi:MAG TPA: DUF1499 domain-containing protein [Nitrospiria bacterium]|nr:DUF1499 domain-containing protein [Nitrospiria bacterium]